MRSAALVALLPVAVLVSLISQSDKAVERRPSADRPQANPFVKVTRQELDRRPGMRERCVQQWAGSCGLDASCICNDQTVYWNVAGCVQNDCSVEHTCAGSHPSDSG